MKKTTVILISLAAVLTLVFSALPASAAKPQDVIEKSNGFPSGEHYNLNIHGKDPITFIPPETDGGGSVFVPLYCPTDGEGQPTEHVRYVSGKKSSATELWVDDACTETIDGSPAVVHLPYESQGYYVFARILGKPQNGKNDPEDRSNFILKPADQIVDISNLIEDGGGGMIPIGLITKDRVYYAGEESFYRFDEPEGKGRGKSKAKDITHLFLYTGWVIDPSLDIYPPATDTEPAGDGVIDENDIPDPLPSGAMDYDSPTLGGNGDGIMQVDEWLAYNADLPEPKAWYFAQEWIFNIADLVITDQGLINDGTKLLQIRFYPVDTTEFEAPGYIVVDKVTNPAGDPQLFDFTLTYPDSSIVNIQLEDTSLPYVSERLEAGTYILEEILPGGWSLTEINVLDPDDGSQKDVGNHTATIDLDPGETVRVIFINTEQN